MRKDSSRDAEFLVSANARNPYLNSTDIRYCAFPGKCGSEFRNPYVKVSSMCSGLHWITDKETGVMWYSNPYIQRFGAGTVQVKEETFEF